MSGIALAIRLETLWDEPFRHLGTRPKDSGKVHPTGPESAAGRFKPKRSGRVGMRCITAFTVGASFPVQAVSECNCVGTSAPGGSRSRYWILTTLSI